MVTVKIKYFVASLFIALGLGICSENSDKSTVQTSNIPIHYKFKKIEHYDEKIVIGIPEFYTPDDGKSSLNETISDSLDFVSRHLDYSWREEKQHFKYNPNITTTDCIDFAYLFKRIFDKKSAERGLDDYRCFVVSGNVDIKLPFYQRKGGHYWNLIKASKGNSIWVDPTVFDISGYNKIIVK